MPFWVWKGSRAALEGAAREQRGSKGEHGGAKGEREGASREHRGAASEQREAQQKWGGSGSSEPGLAAPYAATAAPVIYPAVLLGTACCCLDSYSFQA